MPVSHEIIAVAAIVLFQALVWADLQHRINSMSALSDKITTLTTSVSNLSTAVTTATENSVTPADLAALDDVTTKLDAITASLTPPAQ